VIEPYLITAFTVAVVPFLPTEPVLLGMGVLAASGDASLVAVILVAALGCSISDHMLYAATRFTSGGTTNVLVRGKFGRTVLAWLDRNVTRWGPSLLVAGRWLPAGGTVGALLAGLLRWPLRRFTPISVIGSLLWSTYAVLLGYAGGAITGQPIVGLLCSLALALLAALAVRFFLGRHTTPADAEGTLAGLIVPDDAASLVDPDAPASLVVPDDAASLVVPDDVASLVIPLAVPDAVTALAVDMVVPDNAAALADDAPVLASRTPTSEPTTHFVIADLQSVAVVMASD
jgi:membrane protein DedA with SNARE-associated domain